MLKGNSKAGVTTGASGAKQTVSYDGYNRPLQSVSVDGAVIAYTYTYVSNTQTATTMQRHGQWRDHHAMEAHHLRRLRVRRQGGDGPRSS